jgi:molybdopterin synthase catalytic subunit
MKVLAERHPRLAPVIERMRVAINGDFARSDASVQSGDELDVLPPVAGGSERRPLVTVRRAPLSIDECLASVRHPGAGGLAIFAGAVRDHAEGQPVARLDYEAHETLAVKEMRRIVEAIEAEMDGVRLAALHREGPLEVGELAVVVAASAPHRAEAFAACRAAIDRIKETVPIWKKEWAPDGTAYWVNLDGC